MKNFTKMVHCNRRYSSYNLQALNYGVANLHQHKRCIVTFLENIFVPRISMWKLVQIAMSFPFFKITRRLFLQQCSFPFCVWVASVSISISFRQSELFNTHIRLCVRVFVCFFFIGINHLSHAVKQAYDNGGVYYTVNAGKRVV